MKKLLTIPCILLCSLSFAQNRGVAMRIAEKPVPITIVVSVVADTVRIDNADKIKYISVDGQTFLVAAETLKTAPTAAMRRWARSGKQVMYIKKKK